MTTQHNPAECANLIAEARMALQSGRPPLDDSTTRRRSLRAMADQLEAAQAEIERLGTRQEELLKTIVRVTNETPFPDEIKGWTEQRAKLVAEIGTLRSELIESGRTYQRDMSERAGVIMSLTAERDLLRTRCETLEGMLGSERDAGALRSRVHAAHAERDKLLLQLEARDATIAAGARSIRAYDASLEELRRQHGKDRERLEGELEAARREVGRLNAQRSEVVVALGVENDEQGTVLRAISELRDTDLRRDVQATIDRAEQTGTSSVTSVLTRLRAALAYRAARDKAEQCSRCGRPESPTCCSVPPARRP